MLIHRHHAGNCNCDAQSTVRPATKIDRSGIVAGVVPMLACALCPLCLSTYAKILSLLGFGVVLGSEGHDLLLAVAVVGSVATALWRARQTKRTLPLALTLSGAALVALAHLSGDLHAAEWTGVGLIFASALLEQVRLRRARRLSAARA